MSILSRLGDYAKQAREVEAKYGTSLLRQFVEIARLRRGLGRIGPGDYYTYRLYDPAISREEKRRFVGWRAEPWLDGLNDPHWRCMGLDKVLMYALFRGSGILVPETRAIYLSGSKRPLEGAAQLTSEDELHAWLREPANYPFFSKPSASGFGRGAFLASCYDPSGDAVVMMNGSMIPVQSFARQFGDIEHLGYLFQSPLEQAPCLVASLGTTLSSLRLMILFDESEGPLLHRAFWKIPTGRNMSDNYNSGRTGNLAAAIDMNSGAVIRVINGVGADLREVYRHPDTGFTFADLVVPEWSHIKELACKAALTLPKLCFQQWDVALTSIGPTVLEVNLFATGGSDLTQLLYRKGLLDDTMLRFIKRSESK